MPHPKEVNSKLVLTTSIDLLRFLAPIILKSSSGTENISQVTARYELNQHLIIFHD